MARFLVRRIAQGLLVIVGVTMFVFVVTRMVGDPAKKMLPLGTPEEQVQAFKEREGFNDPILEQFGRFAADAARLDFGESLWQRGNQAMDLVVERLPKTFQLVGAGMLVAIILAVPLGTIAALRPGSWLDKLTVTLSLVGLSMPQFWLGLLLILVFSVNFGWFPTSGAGSLKHLVLPAVTLALPAAGRMAQIVRSSMIDELSRAYVTTAEAKGIPFQAIVVRHTLRNASLPVVTLFGWELIRALAGYTVVVETVFNWPGLGYLAIQAIDREDLVVLQAIVFFVALMVVVVNILIDVAYKLIDPRIKLS